MAKRVATSQLTDRNWDEEDDKEEAGEFKAADAAAMGGRKVITAKRRVPQDNSASGASGGAFKGFGGFGSGGAGGGFGSGGTGGFNFGTLAAKSTAASLLGASAAPQFSFGSASKTDSAIADNGNGEKKSNISDGKPLFNFVSGAKVADVEPPAFKFGGAISASPSASASSTSITDVKLPPAVNSTSITSVSPVSSSDSFKSSRPQHLSELKALNASVTKWITEHVDANPYCILLPIFKDYEKYLAKIDERFVDSGKVSATDNPVSSSTLRFGTASGTSLTNIFGTPMATSSSSSTISGLNATSPKIGLGLSSSNAAFSASASIFATAINSSTATPASSSTTLAPASTSSFPAFKFSASPASSSSLAVSSSPSLTTGGSSLGGFTFKPTATTSSPLPLTSSSAPSAAATTSSSFQLASTSTATTASATTSSAPAPTFGAGLGSTPFSFGAGLGAGAGKPLGVFGASSSATSSSSLPPAFAGFGLPASSQPTSSLFGGITPGAGFFSKPAPLAADKQKSDDQDNVGGDDGKQDEEYVPPVVESTQVKEDDALYTVKCKLLVLKGSEWKDRGVGYLYLKPCGEKTQLLIRADNNLGTVLLNIMLATTLPVKKMEGKGNGVILTCIPNPPVDKELGDKPANLAIRVKTSEERDALYDKIVEFKR